MGQYISKDTLVAEIEKRRKEAESNCGGYKSYDEHRCDSCTVGFYEEFLEILDTLEVKGPNSFIKGYKVGVEEGKREALIEFQKENPNKDLPSNEVLYKIFKLLYECEENDRRTCSVYMNNYEHIANYITKYWEK